MTASDHTLKPFRNLLHQRGHPHMHKTGLESVFFFVDGIYPVVLVTGVPKALAWLRAAILVLIFATCQSRASICSVAANCLGLYCDLNWFRLVDLGGALVHRGIGCPAGVNDQNLIYFKWLTV